MISISVSNTYHKRGIGVTSTAVRVFKALPGSYLVVNFAGQKRDIVREHQLAPDDARRILVKQVSQLSANEETKRALSGLPPETVVIWDIL
jgi:hypothetical protein